ncbi:DNA polymerase III subunit gamma/tau [Uliginosibacterium sp. H3]|uniref:DNA polymerase III subunit gamma/tau n=1 Tax=Uliginosibacterium silvisoli TaxID=3114758 RepID=A0ABU6K3S6_9RHOO|nr:DNA polymerase III subunit gamma/tau [Uliginosibacterium sp. H3]
MSYQVLARKWRPKSFETLVGQEHVVRALGHALQTGRLHHAYLFTGTRGVGKTTISRILAKSLNCETGVTATPCGVCTACTEIDAGRFVDYIEMDAASNRGVDDMAALLEKAAYAPARGRYKVYMIDEVHMLTGHAFNAMLKTLEEPPAHMKFILATTDPQKIPVTVLSRCLQFNLKQMPVTHIVDHLSRVLGEEGVPFEPGALRHIAKGANGSMRDALSLLDQAIAHGAGKVEEEQVIDMLGTVGEDHLYALLDALAAQDIDAMLAAADTMEARALSFDDALQTFASLLHRIALLQFAPQAFGDVIERERLSGYARQFSAEFLQLAYQIVVHGRDELPLAPDEHTGFSMTLLRLHAFRPDAAGAGSGAMSSGSSGAGGGNARPMPAGATPGASAQGMPSLKPAMPSLKPQLQASAPSPAVSAPAMPAQSAAEPPLAKPYVDSRPEAVSMPAALPEGIPDWHELIGAMQLGGLVRELAQNCALIEVAGGAIKLRLAPTHKHLLAMPGTQAKLQEALAKHFGGGVRLNVEIGEPGTQTPAQRNAETQRQRHSDAVAALESDPFVQEVIERFDATLIETSVRPL